MHLLGLDIGGANLKAAHQNGWAQSVPFPLWKDPQKLPHALNELLQSAPRHDRLTVTMTGELCDCFRTKREGVLFILDCVETLQIPFVVWTTEEMLVSVEQARQKPLLVAAANWLALACVAARQFVSGGAGLLIDIGSTTTDIVPLWQGMAIPCGRTDPARLRAGELVYTGVRRTPVCGVLGMSVAAEFFATMLDVNLLLGQSADEPGKRDTADGRPATREFARERLARMMCADGETAADSEIDALAKRARDVQLGHLESALEQVLQSLPSPPRVLVLSGTGEFLGRILAERHLPDGEIVSLEMKWGRDLSQAACAFALTRLEPGNE